jgi:hypothetical protein
LTSSTFFTSFFSLSSTTRPSFVSSIAGSL